MISSHLSHTTCLPLLLVAPCLAQVPDVTILESVPYVFGDYTTDVGRGVSRDASTVVGEAWSGSGEVTIVWSRERGREVFEAAFGCGQNSVWVTPGGEAIVVHEHCIEYGLAIALDPLDGSTTFFPTCGGDYTDIGGVSWDGRIAITDSSDNYEPDENGVMVSTSGGAVLFDSRVAFPDATSVRAVDLTESGRRALLRVRGGAGDVLYFWQSDGSLTEVMASASEIHARDMSSDGQCVVGQLGSEYSFVWHETDGLQVLPGLDGTGDVVLPMAVTDDKSMVLGRAVGEYYLWREGSGWTLVKDFLLGLGAHELAGLDCYINKMSPDGRYFQGTVTGPHDYERRAVLVSLDGPTGFPQGDLLCRESAVGETVPGLHAFGEPDAGTQDLRLVAQGLPVGSVGIFLAGTETGAIVLPGAAQPTCIGGVLWRVDPEPFAASATGQAEVTVDLRHGYFAAGEEYHFQAAYRLGVAGGGMVTTFSEARTVPIR